jgi:hypothetical protein
MTPDPQFPAPGEPVAQPVAVKPPVYQWYHKTWAVIVITFCLEIGLFLLVFPWTEYWDGNFFAAFVPEWHEYWQNMYVRGAVSGLGVVNLYISFSEIFRLRRFARR